MLLFMTMLSKQAGVLPAPALLCITALGPLMASHEAGQQQPTFEKQKHVRIAAAHARPDTSTLSLNSSKWSQMGISMFSGSSS
jgi:hypothetical protein